MHNSDFPKPPPLTPAKTQTSSQDEFVLWLWSMTHGRHHSHRCSESVRIVLCLHGNISANATWPQQPHESNKELLPGRCNIKAALSNFALWWPQVEASDHWIDFILNVLVSQKSCNAISTNCTLLMNLLQRTGWFGWWWWKVLAASLTTAGESSSPRTEYSFPSGESLYFTLKFRFVYSCGRIRFIANALTLC